MTVCWWARYAGKPEMAPLLDQALDPAEAGRVSRLLTARGIDADDRAGQPRAASPPTAGSNAASADLAVSERHAANPSIDFDALMKGMNPWDSASMTDASLINFKETQLGAR